MAGFAKVSSEDMGSVVADTGALPTDWLLNHIIACDMKMRPSFKARPKF